MVPEDSAGTALEDTIEGQPFVLKKRAGGLLAEIPLRPGQGRVLSVAGSHVNQKD
jgi:hypothetical protein